MCLFTFFSSNMDEDAPPGTSFAMTSPKSPKSPRTPKSVRFKKTHRRNESKISKISHLSIRSLGRGGTIDEEDETDGIEDQENLKPIYFTGQWTRVLPRKKSRPVNCSQSTSSLVVLLASSSLEATNFSVLFV